MYLRALQGKEKALEAEHTSTLDTVNNLGNLYNNQGKMAEAEAMYLRDAARVREGMGSGAHIDAEHGQQPRRAVREPRQDSGGGGGGGGNVPAGATRVRECSGSGLSEDATNRSPKCTR